MEFKEPFICNTCEFKISELFGNYKFNRQAMVKRVCDFQSDRCFYDFIHWIKNNFPNQPERSKREDSNFPSILIDPKTNEAFVKINDHMHSLGQWKESLLEYKFEMRCSEHCGNTVSHK